MYTSVWVGTGTKPDNLFLYEFYALFNRISQFKNFEMTSMFKCYSNEQQIDLWYKHIDMFDFKEKKTKLEDFNKKMESIMK
jgi:hypothetical protein